MPRRPRRTLVASALLLAAIVPAYTQQNRQPAASVTRQPGFGPGQLRRYRVSLESESNKRQSGSVKDSQGPAAMRVTWDATIRLEVSAAESNSAPAVASAPLRIRITYEASQATV